MAFLAIFFLPLFFVFNGYCIGRMLKKFNVNINSYFSVLSGIFIYLLIFQLIFTFLYLVKASVLVYYCTIGAVELLLLIFCGINYKAFLCNLNFNNFLFFSFILGCSLSIVGIFLGTEPNNSIHSNNGNLLLEWLKVGDYSIKNSLVIPTNDFSSFSCFNVIFAQMFRINASNAAIYFIWGQYILYCICLSFALFSCLYKANRTNWWNWLIVLIIDFFIVLISYMNYESPLLAEVWLPILIIYYWCVMFKQTSYSDETLLYFLWLSIMSFASFNRYSIVFTVFLSLFSLFYLCMTNKNPFDFLIGIILLLIIQIITSVYIFDSEPLWLICYIAIIIVFVYFLLRKNSTIYYKFRSNASKILVENYKAIFFLLGALIYLISIWLIVNKSYPSEYYIYTYNYLWAIDLSSYAMQIINIVIWMVYCLAIVGSIIYMHFYKIKISNAYFLVFITFAILFYINPIPMIIIKKVFNFYDDFSLLNHLLVIPIILQMELLNSKKSNKKPLFINNN